MDVLILGVLIVDEDPNFHDALKPFEKRNMEILFMKSPLEALGACSKFSCAVIVSYENFEEISGLNFLTTAKNMNKNVKTILLVDEHDDEKEYEALSKGVNKVLKKGRDPKIARHYINRYIDEMTPAYSQILDSKREKITIDLLSYEVTKNNELCHLTPKEYALLVLFLKNKDVVLDRSVIIKKLWGDDQEQIDERTIDVHIKRLRQKLDIKSIVAIRSIGYKWKEG